MSEAVAKLLEQIRALPDADRERLADELAADEADAGYDPMTDPDFRAELDRRLAAVADGTAVLIDADEAFERVRLALEERRAARQSS